MFLTYGCDESGDLIHISTVVSGAKAGLKCPYCQGLLSAKKGEILAHHFAHLKESCRATLPDLPYQFDFFTYGMTPKQIEALELLIKVAREPLRTPDVSRWSGEPVREDLELDEIYSRWIPGNRKSSIVRLYQDGFQRRDALVEMFINRNFFAEQEGRFGIIRLTDKSRAFLKELNIKEFVDFSWQEFERLYNKYAQGSTEEERITFQIYEKERERLAKTHLYFLEIKSGKDKFYKIGITTRPVEERIKEIRAFLAKQGYTHAEISCPFALDKSGLVESYFKACFEKHRFLIGTATEYFSFDKDVLRAVKIELNNLALHTDFHRKRIKKGLEESTKKGGRPRVAETPEQFLAKPKNQQITALLAEGKSLRKIRAELGVSVNTVRAVEKVLREKAAAGQEQETAGED